jgi:mRNA interferase HigB
MTICRSSEVGKFKTDPRMHVIARPRIKEAMERVPDAASWLKAWWSVASKSKWTNLNDVRADYPSTDQVGRCLVFNVRGDNYRLIVAVKYASARTGGTLFVRQFLTHADYNKDSWKKDCS